MPGVSTQPFAGAHVLAQPTSGWGSRPGSTGLGELSPAALGEGRNPRVSIISSAPTGNPVLDRALEILPDRNGKRFSSLVPWRGLNPARGIAASLSAAGIITVDTSGFFGSLSPKYPTVDPVPEQQLRSHIYAVLQTVSTGQYVES